MARKRVLDIDVDTTVKFEEKGQELSGYYCGFKQITTDYGPAKLHAFQTAEGSVGIYGSAKLDSSLGKVPVGTMTFVIYGGKVKIDGGKTMHKYEVEIDDEDQLDTLVGASVNFTPPGNEAADEEEGADAEESADEQDVDDDTVEAADEEEDDAPPAKLTKSPLKKGAPAGVTSAQKSSVDKLLQKTKR